MCYLLVQQFAPGQRGKLGHKFIIVVTLLYSFMLNKIESLRKAPKVVRNRYAFWIATVFTAIVVLFWSVSVPARLAFFTNVTAEDVELQGSISRTFSDIRELISGEQQQEVQAELPEVPASDDSLDFDTFFGEDAAPTPIIEKVDAWVPPARTVLIGTSSKKAGTSTP
ncbi:MAG: hypothetical protein ACI9H6_000630 [Patiriisocius sp.]|jgi:hypothetical protein